MTSLYCFSWQINASSFNHYLDNWWIRWAVEQIFKFTCFAKIRNYLILQNLLFTGACAYYFLTIFISPWTSGLLAAEIPDVHDLSSGVLCQGYVIASCLITFLSVRNVKYSYLYRSRKHCFQLNLLLIHDIIYFATDCHAGGQLKQSIIQLIFPSGQQILVKNFLLVPSLI